MITLSKTNFLKTNMGEAHVITCSVKDFFPQFCCNKLYLINLFEICFCSLQEFKSFKLMELMIVTVKMMMTTTMMKTIKTNLKKEAKKEQN